MAEVRWAPQAASDLEAIADFIAHDSPHYASLFVMNVLEAAEALRPFPRSGRVVPELSAPEIREILLGDYRIVYRLRREAIEILTVHHGARLLNPDRLQ